MVRNVVVKKLAVNAVPRSGKIVLLYFQSVCLSYSLFSGPPMELLEMFGISASHIVKACNDILKM